ncbi:uncharacterized protein LOC114756408 [Neltuma alba]|uniref:uncharacterized protein LOC114725750 n=1 Tax=Neltuma alba TaxID=207710 RepID=UPI0010A4C9CF|nr:uncharacterized protein LOC114725750 [Prosopis alba]XP_028801176.1 uncharacterized protein LOC114756408 [Prosopis alba]
MNQEEDSAFTFFFSEARTELDGTHEQEAAHTDDASGTDETEQQGGRRRWAASNGPGEKKKKSNTELAAAEGTRTSETAKSVSPSSSMANRNRALVATNLMANRGNCIA